MGLQLKTSIIFILLFVSVIAPLYVAPVKADTTDVFTDDFEDQTFDKWDQHGATPWSIGDVDQAGTLDPHGGDYDAFIIGSVTLAYLTSDDIDLSGTSQAGITFWFGKDDIEANEFRLQFSNGSGYNTIVDLDGLGGDDVWLKYSAYLDAEYLTSTFTIRFWADQNNGAETTYVDDVTVNKTVTGQELSFELTQTVYVHDYSGMNFEKGSILSETSNEFASLGRGLEIGYAGTETILATGALNNGIEIGWFGFETITLFGGLIPVIETGFVDVAFTLFEGLGALASVGVAKEISNTLQGVVLGSDSLNSGVEYGKILFGSVIGIESLGRGVEVGQILFESLLGFASLSSGGEYGKILFESMVGVASMSRGLDVGKLLFAGIEVFSGITSLFDVAFEITFILGETGKIVASIISDNELSSDGVTSTTGSGSVLWVIFLTFFQDVTVPCADAEIAVYEMPYNIRVATIQTDSDGMATLYLPVGEYTWIARYEKITLEGRFTHDSEESIQINLSKHTKAVNPTVVIFVSMLLIIVAVCGVIALKFARQHPMG